MTNKYVVELNKLINNGINENEELTREERVSRIKEFRETLSYEKYSNLFNDLQKYILNDGILSEEKEIVIFLVIEFIRSFPKLEDAIELFPEIIKMIYKSFIEYKDLSILFEQIYFSDICRMKEYVEVVNRYLKFLENPNHELFIHDCYSRITIFNESLINYLDKTDFNGIKHRDTINNPELESLLKEKLNVINESRN